MKSKTFEIRDSATFIPVLAVKIDAFAEPEPDHYLLRRAGYGGTPCVIVVKLEGGGGYYDPYDWPGGTRTMTVAHEYITQQFDNLETGAVVDVEFILGETPTEKQSERLVI